MGRRKKYRQPQNISVIFEREERDHLRLEAAERNLSVSAYIRFLVMSMWRHKSAKQKHKDKTDDRTEL